MNWLEHIKIRYSFRRALAFFLLITLMVSLGSCAYYIPKEPKEQETEEPLQTPVSIVPVPPETSSEPAEPPEESPPPSYTGPDVAAADMMGDEFFEDAAFMGNSLIDGFRVFSGITTSDYYAATSMTVVGATSNACIPLDNGAMGTVVDGLIQKPYAKIYILLGINEIAMNLSSFVESYGAMLDIIIAAQPDCDIYIMGLTPISYAKSTSADVFTMERIGEYNTALYQLAAEKECYYLDLVTALSDDTGYLPADQTTDGVHFSADIYKKWADYIRTHYV